MHQSLLDTTTSASAPPSASAAGWPNRLRSLLWPVPVVLLSIVFGLKFGLNFGVNNQLVYLLPGLRILDPALFTRDWLVMQAAETHPVFGYLSAALMALDPSGWVFAVGNVAANATMLLLYFWIALKLTDRRTALIGFAIFAAMTLVVGTRSVAQSYAAGSFLQPSTFGALGMIAGTAFFVRQRWFAAGTAMALGGMIHVNYLVLCIPVLGIAHLCLGRAHVTRNTWRLFLPVAVVFVLFLPMLLGAGFAPNAEEGRRILFDVRSPHHYIPSVFAKDFQPFAIWTIVGVAAAGNLLGSQIRRWSPVGAILLGTLCVTWGGSVLTTAVNSPTIASLFVWRLAPFAVLLSQLLLSIVLAKTMSRPLGADTTLSPAAVTIMLACFGLLLVDAGLGHRTTELTLYVGIVVAVLTSSLLVTSIQWLTKGQATGLLHRIRQKDHSLAFAIALCAGLCLWATVTVAGAIDVKDIKGRSSLLTDLFKRQEKLFAWATQHTPKDTLFLVPPLLDTFRFHARRSVVVDWKGAPMVPRYVVDWYQRISDVAGRTVTKSQDATIGYSQIDADRVISLQHKYGFDYAVVERRILARNPTLKRFAVVYKDNWYAVLKPTQSPKAVSTD